MVKQPINALSLRQLLTIIDWQVISLTSVLVFGRHGAVSWDYDSDVLCTHHCVCSFVTVTLQQGTGVFHYYVVCGLVFQTLERV